MLNGLRGIWESPIRMSLALMMNIINSGFVWGSASLSGFVCFKHTPLSLPLCVRIYFIHVCNLNVSAELRMSFHLVHVTRCSVKKILSIYSLSKNASSNMSLLE